MAAESLIDTVDELRQLVAELRRLLYGDPGARVRGLVKEFEAQDQRLSILELDVQRLLNRRPIVSMWVGGFLAFAAAIVLTGVGFVNLVSHANMMDISPQLAWGLAACLTTVSLIMFLGGFGWLDRR